MIEIIVIAGILAFNVALYLWLAKKDRECFIEGMEAKYGKYS